MTEIQDKESQQSGRISKLLKTATLLGVLAMPVLNEYYTFKETEQSYQIMELNNGREFSVRQAQNLLDETNNVLDRVFLYGMRNASKNYIQQSGGKK